MKVGDLVKFKGDLDLIGVVMHLKSWETLNDMVVVHWHTGEVGYEYVVFLRVIHGSRK